MKSEKEILLEELIGLSKILIPILSEYSDTLCNRSCNDTSENIVSEIEDFGLEKFRDLIFKVSDERDNECYDWICVDAIQRRLEEITRDYV